MIESGGGNADQGRAGALAVPSWLIWSALLALGLIIFLKGYLPARQETARTEKLVRQLEKETDELREERDRLTLKTRALQDDPTEIEREVRRQGRGPNATVPVIEEEDGR